MNRGTLVGIVAAAGAALIAAGLVYTPNDRQAQEPVAPRVPPGALPTNQVAHQPVAPVIAEASKEPVAATRANASAKLQKDFHESSDWRAFVLTAMQRPEEGGYFYARHVLDLCSRDLRALQKDASAAAQRKMATAGTIDGAQQTAAEQTFGKCSGFLQGEADSLSRELTRKAASGEDPLVNAERSAFRAAQNMSADEAREATATVLNLGDPMLISRRDLLRTLSAASTEARKRSAVVFDGAFVSAEQGSEYTYAVLALEAGACTDNAPCALDDELRMVCATTGRCYPDRDAYIRDQLAASGAKPEAARKVMEMAGQVRAAVSARNVNFFVR